jgi:polar amino acid transport system permease protein
MGSTREENPLLETFFNWDIIGDTFPRLLAEGIRNTLLIALLSIILGVVIGLVGAMLLLSTRWWVRLPARIYVDVFRGLPVVVTVMVVGIGLPAAGFRPFGREAFGYAVMAVGIISGAYLTEIFRSGIQSVEIGQMQAARSLGMSYLSAMRLVIVPQGIRRILPATGGQLVKDVKESSLVYVLGLGVGSRDLFFIAQEEVSRTYNSSPLIAVAVCYLAITIPLTYCINWLDRRLREGPGHTSVTPDPVGAPTDPDLAVASGGTK